MLAGTRSLNDAKCPIVLIVAALLKAFDNVPITANLVRAAIRASKAVIYYDTHYDTLMAMSGKDVSNATKLSLCASAASLL